MKKIATLCVALAVSVACSMGTAQANPPDVTIGPPVAQKAAPIASPWTYAGNQVIVSFIRNPANPQQWTEKRSDGTTFFYTVTQHTADFVELYDARNGISIRLFADEAHIKRGTDDFFLFMCQRGLTPPGAFPADAPEAPPATLPGEPAPGVRPE